MWFVLEPLIRWVHNLVQNAAMISYKTGVYTNKQENQNNKSRVCEMIWCKVCVAHGHFITIYLTDKTVIRFSDRFVFIGNIWWSEDLL